jgi:hypothetical protein
MRKKYFITAVVIAAGIFISSIFPAVHRPISGYCFSELTLNRSIAAKYDLPEPMLTKMIAAKYDLPEPMLIRVVARRYDLPEPMFIYKDKGYEKKA